MAVATSEAVDIAHEYLAFVRKQGLPAVGAVLYGSHARGEASPDSDIDLLVLLEDTVPGEDIDEIHVQLWKLIRGVDTRIEPIVVRSSTFETDDETPLLEVIRREGVRIAA
ncbi:MAG: nucleotidyltransferase domain-containing protein [Candidatus Hydrogenedentes bacterium]|nr:nucleotidyltransferase domain-containing protein [Candidatus Hydrogenedentota bacterium]